jgi:hypothetical protein
MTNLSIQWLLGWWNLLFIVPFALALMYLGIYTLSGLTFGDVEVDHDIDTDVDADVDAHIDVDHDIDTDVDHDVDADADHDVESDHDADSDSDHEANEASTGGSNQSAAMLALSWLGVGKIPASIVLMVLAMSWGAIGFIANQALRGPVGQALHKEEPAAVALGSIPLAGLGALLITSFLSRTAARALPKLETYAQRKHQLLGNVGEAIYDIDRKFGMANVRDDRGNLFQIACRLDREGPAVPKGSRVKLTGYNAGDQVFYVVQEKQINA